MSPAPTDFEIVEQAHELALDFFRTSYPKTGLMPGTKLYEGVASSAFPSWALACHAYEKLLGINVREALQNLKGKEQHE